MDRPLMSRTLIFPQCLYEQMKAAAGRDVSAWVRRACEEKLRRKKAA